MQLHNPEFKPFTEHEAVNGWSKSYNANPSDYEHLYSYSEHPEKLKSLLGELKVSIKDMGIKKHFPEDKATRRVLEVTLERAGRSVSFEFGQSIVDTEKPLKKLVSGLLYDVLACCGADYYIPTSFNDFCDEFGYNQDSIRDRETFINCKEQQSKLEQIFTDDEIDCLPR